MAVSRGEHFRGVLMRFMRKFLDSGTSDGFEDMNVAFNTRAEAVARAQS